MFVKNLRIAEETANKKERPVEVLWREFKTVVEPSKERFSVDDLRGRLLQALKAILKIHGIKCFPPKEEKVCLHP